MKLLMLGAMLGMLTGCMTVNITTGPCASVTVQLDKAVSSLPVNATGNTVPISAIP